MGAAGGGAAADPGSVAANAEARRGEGRDGEAAARAPRWAAVLLDLVERGLGLNLLGIERGGGLGFAGAAEVEGFEDAVGGELSEEEDSPDVDGAEQVLFV